VGDLAIVAGDHDQASDWQEAPPTCRSPSTEAVRTLVETGVAELVAAALWAESG